MKLTKLFTTLAFFTTITLSYSQITNSLVAEYSFNNGDASDEVGTNNATVNGATLTSDRFGNTNKAYYFDGVNDYMTLGSSTTLKPTSGTISMWVKMTALSSSGSGFAYNPVFNIRNTSNSNAFFEGCALYISTSDSKLVPVMTDFSTQNEIYYFTTNTIPTGTWKHYVIKYNDDSLWFYINGQLDKKMYKGFTSTFSTTEPVYIANSGDGVHNRYFNGSIDDIKIYNRTLSANEIVSLYNESNPLTGIFSGAETKNSISIYPNPSSESINFSKEVNVELINSTGFPVMKESNCLTLNISKQVPGIYFIKLKDEKEQIIQTSKIVIE